MPEPDAPIKSQVDEAEAKDAGRDLPLSYARTLSSLSLAVVLLTNLALSFFISNSARETLLTRQENFLRVLVENLNYQIFRRFALPTILANGRISLRQPSQYERLDQVVQSVIHGLPVDRLRIYDFSHIVAYSTNKEELGRSGLAPPNVEDVLYGEASKSQIISNIPAWQAPFRIPFADGDFVLRVLYPLRGEPLQPDMPPPVMGALEVTQDITDDYEQVLTFQGIIVSMCLLSSVVMFALLLMLIHRAERALAARMQKTRQLERELHSNEKLAGMGRVISGIAHEIRNPLGIIRSSAEFLQKRMDKTDAGAARILGAIYDESVRLSQTVNDFLDYARPRQPRQDTADINLILDQTLAFLEGEMGRCGVSVERQTAPGLFVLGDKDLLYRAFYNILVNGQQAMDGPGVLRVSADRDDRGRVRLEFLDSGKGFDPAILPRLLDPFFTTKDGGTGLGLPIVQSIIVSHGGAIEFENAPQGGALVRVLLPAAPQRKKAV
ncbi:MAG: two-component sensor histidine kinase [Desulfovibrio sp.]|jgi:signal transduction histidine kinase|nr:two-component sensor histidine kinase [Desulfovibrio sp.]